MKNREIKFRGWFQGINGQEYWAYGYLVKQTNGNWEITNGERSWTVDDVGQYTGLKDKNGKEIYEGDIVNVISDDLTHENVLVSWHDELCGFQLGYFDHVMSIYNEYEVVGNVYETPNLLK